MDYQNKYLKYKNKYLQLQKSIQQKGGNKQKKISDLNEIKTFFRTMLNNNIIDGKNKLKSISGTSSKILENIDPNNITEITINKYDYEPENPFFELFLNDSTVKYKNEDDYENDLLKLLVKKNDKLYKELTDTWDFI